MPKKKDAIISRGELNKAVDEFIQNGGEIKRLPPDRSDEEFNPVNEQGFRAYYSTGSYISGLGAKYA